ncbi:M14 family metallopeptidase [Micromonospora sp. WMMD1082]|uniref:M14 family metallopeptidase n=1 Tax=Micromonospora sp. WMMD1082 TaxID=3016104 RepID=UPI002417D94A|nr:M14 family metallopeptidase [Micromonospora sp. WMMD1082]MDG4792513.1 M14 family metallopeptidase [Micromonospora sp. WMMD1082]
MSVRRPLVALLAAVLLFGAAPGTASATPVDPAALGAAAGSPRGPSDTDLPFDTDRGVGSRSAGALGGQPHQVGPSITLPGKPRNDVIRDVPVDPGDASIPLNLIPYHDIPAALRALQQSRRISVEVIGRSVLGRDLHLVVATSPMRDAEWKRWQQLSDLRFSDPRAALATLRAGGYDRWRTPLFVNNNIHGNEWEGTDASLQVLRELAFSDDPEVVRVLDRHVIAFVVTNNPDGRVAATRANANGFDMNRDYITASQPEVRAVRAQLVRYSPLTMLDIHGYVTCTLIEPTTGPHGDNYEYDLYIRHALRHALAMEQAVLATGEERATCANPDGGRRTDIPFRDRAQGWDDWPPIFTPMYAMYHGTIGHTVEIPLNPRGDLTEAERHERTRINTAVAAAAIRGNLGYATQHRAALLANQLEWFRRGVAGEPTRPIDDPLALSLARGDNAKTHPQSFPRAYVIPAGAGQRSATAAARLVQFMLDNDLTVHRASRPFRLDGTRYPAGSYVVDMRQAKRGLASALLEVGRDVTDDFAAMYDISAWSHGHLWGATVRPVNRNVALDGRALRPVTEARAEGVVPPGRQANYGLVVDSVAGIRAVNRLVDDGVKLARTPGGTFVVPGDVSVVRAIAKEYGVEFTRITPPQVRTATPVTRTRLGVAANAGEIFALRQMGFDPVSVTHTGFNSGALSFDDVDALFVSTTSFNPLSLDATQAAAFDRWLAGGGTVVGRGAGGIQFNDRAGLLDVTAAAGRSDANGIVTVQNDPASPIAAGALPTAFVDAPQYFTRVGDGVRVDQRLAGAGFFLAGHWGGQEAAAGHAVVVSGVAKGASVSLFGTEPLFRAHPEGLYPQVANALWWNGA